MYRNILLNTVVHKTVPSSIWPEVYNIQASSYSYTTLEVFHLSPVGDTVTQ